MPACQHIYVRDSIPPKRILWLYPQTTRYKKNTESPQANGTARVCFWVSNQRPRLLSLVGFLTKSLTAHAQQAHSFTAAWDKAHATYTRTTYFTCKAQQGRRGLVPHSRHGTGHLRTAHTDHKCPDSGPCTPGGIDWENDCRQPIYGSAGQLDYVHRVHACAGGARAIPNAHAYHPTYPGWHCAQGTHFPSNPNSVAFRVILIIAAYVSMTSGSYSNSVGSRGPPHVIRW